MKWEEYKKTKTADKVFLPEWAETDIECPECNERIYVNTREVLTSYPPKSKYKCVCCGWTGTA